MKNYEIKIFDSFSKELVNNWNEFEIKSSHHIFQTLKWQKLWYEKQHEYKYKIKNCIIFIYEDNKLIMILPLNIKNYHSIKILSWSGFPFSDYNIPLIIKDKQFQKDDFKIIWNNILKKIQNFDCIVLANQPENIFNKKNPFYHFLYNKINNEYNGIELKKGFHIKKNELDNIRYQVNRLEKIGKLEFKIARDLNEKKKVLEYIIQHKSKQYINTKAWNLFKEKFNTDFFILSNLALEDKAYITYMEIDKKIIAAHSGYVYGNTYYYLFPVYDIEYKKYSPGKILLKKIIEDSKLNLINYFDLTIGTENYKRNYSNNTQYSATFLHSINLKGSFFIFLLKLKEFFKKILKLSKF